MPNVAELQKIPLLSSVDKSELEKLALVIHQREVKKNAYILHEDDPGRNLMFVAKGKVKISLVSNEGKEVVITHFDQGDFFGEIALLTGETRSTDVVAVESTTLYVLSEDDFNNHLKNNTGLSHALLKELALRLRASSGKIGDLVLYDVYRRVARTLKSIAKPSELNGEKVHIIDKRPTHQELASMVGTSREMVTRALKGLEEDECIVADGKKIVIHRLPL